MSKPPEEGKIWEWRAFGQVTQALAAKVQVYPIRLGVSDLRGEDVYLVAPHCDHNVKLRRYAGGWFLKFKILLETAPGHFELYNESAALTYQMPVSLDTLREAAELLEVTLPEFALRVASFNVETFVKALAESSPAVTESRVSKRRSQHQFEGGWLELADVKFETESVQSLSIHSTDIDEVRKMLGRLGPREGLEAMNYIEASRRWG